MGDKYHYLAFISYKREDEKWAKWLQHKLEHYKLPNSTRKDNPSLPEKARPIFKDTTDLSGGVLEQAIKEALDTSRYLIVICSPRAARSKWVCKEVQEFIDSGREKYIIPFIIDGEPFSNDVSEECYPENLRNLTGKKELLGININEMGRDAAAIKVVARMFNIRFDTLWQRWEREQRNRRRWIVGISLVGAFLALCIAGFMFFQHRKMQINRARAVAQRAQQLVEEGDSYLARRLLLEVLPQKDNFFYRIFRPYVPEVEASIRAAYRSSSAILRGHTDESTYITCSPTNQYIASISDNNCIRIWDAKSGKCIQNIDNIEEVGHDDYITSVVFGSDEIKSVHFSSDEKTLVSVSTSGNIRIWDIHQGTCIDTSTLDFEFTSLFRIRRAKLIHSKLFSNSNRLLSLSSDNILRFWDIEKKSCYKTIDTLILPASLQKHRTADSSTEMKSFTLSSDDKHLVIVGLRRLITGEAFSIYYVYDEFINVWDTEQMKCIQSTPINHYESTSSLEETVDRSLYNISPNGKYIAVFKNGAINIFEINGGKQIYSIPIKDNHVSSIDFSHNCELIAITYYDKILIWNINTGSCFQEYKSKNGFINEITFSSDDNQIIVALDDNNLHMFDITPYYPYKILFKLDEANVIDLSPSGKHLLTTALFGKCVSLYDIDKKTCIGEIRTEDRFSPAAWFPVNEKNFITADTSVGIWDFDPMECSDTILNVKKHDNTYPDIYINTVSISPNEKYIIIAGTENKYSLFLLLGEAPTAKILLCNLNNPKSIDTLTYHKSRIKHIDFSPNEKYFVTASDDKSIRIWDIKSKLCTDVLNGHIESVNYIDFSPNGKYIVSASDDKSIRIWDIKSKKCTDVLNGHIGSVKAVHFTSEGRYIASASSDKSIRIWDVSSKKCIDILNGHTKGVSNVEFSPDGSFLVSSSYDGTIRVWEFKSLQELIDETRERFKNCPLTANEREKYYLE